MDERVAKFKNTLVGTLCSELSEGEDLTKACLNWNKRVDPANYMKATAPITESQKKMAKDFVSDNGYGDSFDRRLAIIDDIKASEIKYVNSGDGTIKEVSVFDKVSTKSTRHKRSEFENVDEVSIDKFMQDILPNCTSMEVLLENKHENNLVTMTTSKKEGAKKMFKWDNPYSWTYKGNLAGKSMIKENVKNAGGNVSGFMRFSIQWNDEDTRSIVDFDAHCTTPYAEIYYSDMHCYDTKGTLDVDMIDPHNVGVENITWSDQSTIHDGDYKFRVKNFNGKNNTGVKAELEINGKCYNYFLQGNLKGFTEVVTVKVKNGVFDVVHHAKDCLLYTSPSPRDATLSRMPSSA